MFRLDTTDKNKTKTMYKNIRDTILIIALLVLAAPLSGVNAQTESNLRNEIKGLNNELGNAKEGLSDAHHESLTLQTHINELNADINELQGKISTNKKKINLTKTKIKEAEQELARQQEIMNESIRTLYKQGNVSTVELIAASENFSDFINQQEYIERVKINVAEAAEKVKALKEELEKRKAELTQLVEKLEGQKKIVEDKRKTQQRLLNESRGREAEYKAYIENLKEKQKAAERRLEKLLSSRQNYVNLGYVNPGDVIGKMGNSGCDVTFNCGAHLHTELRKGPNFSDVTYYDPVANYQSGNMTPPLSYWPVPAVPASVTSSGQKYGCRSHASARPNWPSCPSYAPNLHAGTDIGHPAYSGFGTPIHASGSGTIIHRGWYGGYGWTVIVDHNNGYYSLYAHMMPGS